MFTFDASSVIHAWDNYPIENFPPLWDWFAAQVADDRFSISGIALEETAGKSPECGEWLRENGIRVLPLSNKVLHQAAMIKNLLGIDEDNYHPKGVGENDLLIIGTAKVSGLQLISDESKQFRLPTEKRRYKIPAVCGLPQVEVCCIQFVDLIKASGAVFR